MRNRTFFVQMPSTAVDMDIMVGGFASPVASPAVSGSEVISSMGTKTRPVAGSAYGSNRIVPPAGWVAAATDGYYFEWRGRPFRPGPVSGATGFVPWFNLGWHLSVITGVSGPAAEIVLSESLTGPVAIAPAGVIITDPSYGPVIRIKDDADLRGKGLFVLLGVCEDKDEDRSPTGV